MRIFKVGLIITLLFACSFSNAQTKGGVLLQDYEALEAIYKDLDGNNWTNKTNWLSGNVSTWYGIFVENGRVSRIELPNNNLKGSLPPSFINLTKLNTIYLQNNNIVGTIPKNIGDISGLKYFSISNNQFTDKIPDSFWTLKDLVDIQFNNNKLQGTLPEDIGNLTELMFLRLEFNQFEGPLPFSLWNLKKLVRLQLRSNNFWGQIVENIGNLQDLKFLYLSNNEFSGKIPLSLYTISSLRELRIGENGFIGDLSPDVGNLTNLEILEAQTNNFSGSIPNEISNLYKLQQLDLSVNNFIGEIPKGIGSLTMLNSLKLNANDISGSIPVSFWNLTKLETCDLSSNKLSGSLSENIGKLKLLRILKLHSNQFSGKFPTNIGNLSNITLLQINNNSFSGDLPSTINNLGSLQDFNFRNNEFVNLPELKFNSLVNLDSFICDSNRFTFEDFQINDLFFKTVYVNKKEQKPFGVDSILYATDNNPFSFRMSCGGIKNIYYWKCVDENGISGLKKNAVLTGDTISFFPVKYENSGYYSVSVTNNSVEGLILNSKTYRLIVTKSCLEKDSLALRELYNSLGGNRWTRQDNWLKGPLSTWYGVTIDSCNVTAIELPNNNISGILPDTIGSFSKLRVLNLSGNNINNGNIPEAINGLTSLEVLDLSHNEIVGSIPSTIRDLDNLKYLDLSHNQMDGTIPPELGGVSALEVLKLNNNGFSGDINGNISDLSNIIHLNISYNNLSGSIGKTISGMPKVEQFIANNNQLSGYIPTSTGLLTSLDTLRLENNKLEGVIPTEIGNLANLVFLGLSNNQLVDNIPESLWGLTNLEVLLLGDNDLTGGVSESIGDLTKLLVLTLNNNELEGKIPDSFKYLDDLMYLYLNNNHFEGDLPEGVGSFNNLIRIALNDNNFSEIPSLNNVDSLVTTENNRLTFEDLERSAAVINGGDSIFTYIPQQEFGREYDTVAIEGSLFNLPIFCGGANNHYVWYKDGNVISGPDDYEIVFPAFQPSDTGTYYITVTNDIIGGLTLKSRPVHVKLLPRPVTISPVCGVINTELELELCWEELDWEDSYEIQISKDPMFTELVVGDPPEIITTSCYYYNEFEYGTTYYWQVRAEKNGVFSSWSDVCSFTTKPEVPDCPEYISPENNYEFFFNQPLTIKWGGAPRADTIIFQLSKDPDFSKTEYIVTEIIDSVFNEYSFLPSELENATYYYWRVLPKNFTGITECETRTLIPAIEVIPVNLVAIDGAHITNFTIKNIETYPDNSLKIFNRWGKKIYETTKYINEFDFSSYPSGTYYYILNVSNGLNKKQYKSFVEVVKK